MHGPRDKLIAQSPAGAGRPEIGSGMLWPGFLNAITNLVSALYSFPGGWLAARIGEKRSLLVFNLMTIGGFALVVTVPQWQAVILGSFLFLSWSAISLPATMGLVSKSLPKQKHVMGVTWHSLIRRFPMALGPIIGGIFIDRWGPITGVRLAFGGAIVMAIVALVAQQILIEEDQKLAPQEEHHANPFRLVRGFTPALHNLLVADILIRFCEQIPYAYVVLWCMASLPGQHNRARHRHAVRRTHWSRNAHGRSVLHSRGENDRAVGQEAVCGDHLYLISPVFRWSCISAIPSRLWFLRLWCAD